MISYETQKIKLDGIPNARQLGGYIGAGGKKVKNNVILRTGALYDASAEALDALHDKYRLSDIIDLRMPQETAVMPEPEVKGARYHHISVLNSVPISEEDFMLYRKFITIPDLYKRYTEMFASGIDVNPLYIYKSLVFDKDGIEGYKKFFDILLNKPEDAAVLFHCTQGKDRTGIGAVLLLCALGVDKETAMKDYLMTNEACAGLLENVRRVMSERGASKEQTEFALFIESVSLDFITPVFDEIEQKYGLVRNYLEKELDITKDKTEKLRQIYLEN